MEKLRVRPLQSEDIRAIAAIELAAQPSPWTPERFAAELSLPQSRLTVAEYAGGVAGYLCAWEVAGELEIQNVVTAPDCRRRGVAAALLEELLAHARRAGAVRLLLEVRSGNDGALALYRRYGFVACGRRRGYYADGEDALLMELILA